MRPRYSKGSDGSVLCDYSGDGRKTVTVPAQDFPIDPWKVASLMDAAYFSGYVAAQREIRAALGLL